MNGRGRGRGVLRYKLIQHRVCRICVGLVSPTLTMYKSRTDDVQSETDTAYNHDEFRVFDAWVMLEQPNDDRNLELTLDGYKPLDSL